MPPNQLTSLDLSWLPCHYLWLYFTWYFYDTCPPGSGFCCEALFFWLIQQFLQLLSEPPVAWPHWLGCAPAITHYCWNEGRQTDLCAFSGDAQSASCGHWVAVKLKQILAANQKAFTIKGSETQCWRGCFAGNNTL